MFLVLDVWPGMEDEEISFDTSAFVVYCVFRFSALIQQGRCSDPVKLILYDFSFQVGFFLWGLSCVLIIYAGKWNPRHKAGGFRELDFGSAWCRLEPPA